MLPVVMGLLRSATLEVFGMWLMRARTNQEAWLIAFAVAFGFVFLVLLVGLFFYATEP